MKGKVVIITGGAQGIGRATAMRFQSKGASVVIADVDEEAGREAETESAGALQFVETDVADEEQIRRLTAETVRRLGGIDVLVNNAAILLVGPVLQIAPADFRSLVEINQIGCFLGVQAAARSMLRTGGGSIINISSVDGLQGTPGVAAYASTKWAVRGITRVAAVELGRSGVRVNAILPGGMSTPMAAPAVNVKMGLRPGEQIIDSWPLGRLSAPEEVATLAVFLASDESSYCTGSEFVVDGGATAGPDYLDRSIG